jgi:N-acetyl-anhydromuramyl-L-alanine amidase AmpD
MKSIWEPADSLWEIDRLGVRSWPGLPTGITVHYTADGDLERVKREMNSSKVGYHFIVDRDGLIHQTANLAKAVNHAGKAMWNGQSPNRTHLAVAFISWGHLDKDGRAWNGMKVLNPVKRRGLLWDPATEVQEKKLLQLLSDLMRDFDISPMNICGHDECALPAGRKADPGGSLSKSMAEIRKGFAI